MKRNLQKTRKNKSSTKFEFLFLEDTPVKQALLIFYLVGFINWFFLRLIWKIYGVFGITKKDFSSGNSIKNSQKLFILSELSNINGDCSLVAERTVVASDDAWLSLFPSNCKGRREQSNLLLTIVDSITRVNCEKSEEIPNRKIRKTRVRFSAFTLSLKEGK